MSALGFLVAEPSFEIVRGRIEPLADSDLAAVNRLLAGMQAEAARIVQSSVPGAPLTIRREVAVRYEGQSYELNVLLGNGPLTPRMLKRIEQDFITAYSKRYHALAEQSRLESVRWRVRVSAAEKRSAPRLGSAVTGADAAAKAWRMVYLPEARAFKAVAVYDRYTLATDQSLNGPAIIEEAESTVYIGPGAKAVIAANGDLRVRPPAKRSAARGAAIRPRKENGIAA
jgi:N-methylhydantoinase A/oxoprolinase/acetone carboxylase beta subunit